MNRRNLLKSFAALGAASVTGQLFATPATQNRLLLVFLRGGYDASNLLIPPPAISISKPDPTSPLPNPATTQNRHWH